MALITDTRPAVKENVDGYEPDTEQEMENEERDEEVTPMKKKDETPMKKKKGETPMKKKKGDKPKPPKVRDLIEAQRDDLAVLATQEDMEVRVISL